MSSSIAGQSGYDIKHYDSSPLVATVEAEGVEMIDENSIYPSYAYPASHPDSLATTATLYGMDPPCVETASILSLGCGSGGNLLPMAFNMPEAKITGVDMSALRQMEPTHGMTVMVCGGESRDGGCCHCC